MGHRQIKSKIIAFGASLTEWSFSEHTRGFGWALQQKYAGKAEVINEGKAGYTSDDLNPHFHLMVQKITAKEAPKTLFITILVGANDACFRNFYDEYVPLSRYDQNIRDWIDTVLIEDKLVDTKIVLITPPPINIPEDRLLIFLDDEQRKADRGYRTYMNKKRYAEQVMRIAKDYEHTGLVVGLNIWQALIDAALKEQGRLGDEDAYDPDRLPGCGLSKAQAFPTGYFTDGLHFGSLGYDVISNELNKLLETKWPEVLPHTLN